MTLQRASLPILNPNGHFRVGPLIGTQNGGALETCSVWIQIWQKDDLGCPKTIYKVWSRSHMGIHAKWTSCRITLQYGINEMTEWVDEREWMGTHRGTSPWRRRSLHPGSLNPGNVASLLRCRSGLRGSVTSTRRRRGVPVRATGLLRQNRERGVRCGAQDGSRSRQDSVHSDAGHGKTSPRIAVEGFEVDDHNKRSPVLLWRSVVDSCFYPKAFISTEKSTGPPAGRNTPVRRFNVSTEPRVGSLGFLTVSSYLSCAVV